MYLKMRAEASKLYNYVGYNPFTDSQGRNFSDIKISNEFYPISRFWSLYNDHHEILIGTRGSGKTFLLKMMRRSMIAHIESDLAQRILNDKVYFPFYVPMHMETVAALNDERICDERKISLFKFVFNSLLAESIIEELIRYIDAVEKKQGIELSLEFAAKINDIWFPDEKSEGIIDLCDLEVKVRQKSYNFDYLNGNINDIPVIFRRDFAGPLLSVQLTLERIFEASRDSMWIICIDEAEFIPELFQKCINSFMRSNTNRIALKIATLPYYWKTLETLDENINISAENDFNYLVLDMNCESEDFVSLTNKLCKHRAKSISEISLNVDCLEDFLGVQGNDNRIDYYSAVMGEEKASNEQVMADIISSFSDKRKEGSSSYPNKEKTIHQKFAPVLYTREIYKLQHSKGKGHFIPGWYAGADIVRKVSQGNPRLFIRLMSSLFTKATTSREFTTKVQHQVICKFAEDFCSASQAIEIDGHMVYEKLSKTGEYIFDKVHNGPLISVGNSFRYKYTCAEEFEEWKKWLQRAIAFSKITVSEKELITGLSEESEFIFSNAYAVKYWIPMRNDVTTVVPTSFAVKKEEDGQISLFDI